MLFYCVQCIGKISCAAANFTRDGQCKSCLERSHTFLSLRSQDYVYFASVNLKFREQVRSVFSPLVSSRWSYGAPSLAAS